MDSSADHPCRPSNPPSDPTPQNPPPPPPLHSVSPQNHLPLLFAASPSPVAVAAAQRGGRGEDDVMPERSIKELQSAFTGVWPVGSKVTQLADIGIQGVMLG
ncbi:hypothetical protein WN943_013727 [Citrus x changshan-huyou]